MNCPKVECKKKSCCGLTYVELPAALGDDSVNKPKNGDYCGTIVKYEANGAVYIYSKEGIPVKVKDGKEN